MENGSEKIYSNRNKKWRLIFTISLKNRQLQSQEVLIPWANFLFNREWLLKNFDSSWMTVSLVFHSFLIKKIGVNEFMIPCWIYFQHSENLFSNSTPILKSTVRLSKSWILSNSLFVIVLEGKITCRTVATIFLTYSSLLQHIRIVYEVIDQPVKFSQSFQLSFIVCEFLWVVE